MHPIDPTASGRDVDTATMPELGWLSRALLAGMARLRRYVQDRRAFAQLQAMPDWQLHDIGITRYDIPDAVAGRFRRPGPDRLR